MQIAHNHPNPEPIESLREIRNGVSMIGNGFVMKVSLQTACPSPNQARFCLRVVAEMLN